MEKFEYVLTLEEVKTITSALYNRECELNRLDTEKETIRKITAYLECKLPENAQ